MENITKIKDKSSDLISKGQKIIFKSTKIKIDKESKK